MSKQSRPSLSYTTIHRIADAIPITKSVSTPELVSNILQSHGYGISDMKSDIEFWGRIQRSLKRWSFLINNPQDKRDSKRRRATFYADFDPCHKRLELLRELFYSPGKSPGEVCPKFGISLPSFYRLVSDYKQYGLWAVISAIAHGKEGMSSELQLKIILEKMGHPDWSSEEIIKMFDLRVSRFLVHRVIRRWGLEKRDRPAVSLNEFLDRPMSSSQQEAFQSWEAACHIISEKNIPESRRINRHFELICQKMKSRPIHICDPGLLLLAPFVNELGVVQAFEKYGPFKLRGKEITNLPLLNVFRILAGYRRINHLSNNRDRTVALASGVGMYGSTSKYYEDTIAFKFDQLHQMRCDLTARVKELGVIEGMKIGYGFHFKQFYGSNAGEKEIGKGPDKSGDMVAGFRPHVAWDLANNVIINMAYYNGRINFFKTEG